jgi:hypothetical protein
MRETVRKAMSENRIATHRHKTHGAVVLLETTAQLAKVLVVDQGDEMWVKLTDLLEGAQAITKKRARTSSAKDRPNSSANANYRIVRVV